MRILIVALLVTLAGCTAPADDVAPEPDTPVETPPAAAEAFYVNFTGTLSRLPTGTASESFEFQVPNATGRMTATLLWSAAATEFVLDLAPEAEGAGHNGGRYDAPGNGRVAGDLPEPSAGKWTATVTITEGVQADYTLTLFIAPDDTVQNVLSDSFVLASGQFFEINTVMPLNGTMHWDWHIEEGTDSAFNLHTHFDGEVQYLVEETTDAHAGKVVADREGGYSLMWENEGAPQTIVYRVWGDFEVDSYFPPR